MRKDDYEVIAYKILAYYYACLKEGIRGSVINASELVGCNASYFGSVVEELMRLGLLKDNAQEGQTESITSADLSITLEGVGYLDSPMMVKVCNALGEAFEPVLSSAVRLTALL